MALILSGVLLETKKNCATQNQIIIFSHLPLIF